MVRGTVLASWTVCCAVATVSYLPRARVAAESWRRHHPDSPFVLLLIDGQDWPLESEPFQVVLPEELGLTPEELRNTNGYLQRVRAFLCTEAALLPAAARAGRLGDRIHRHRHVLLRAGHGPGRDRGERRARAHSTRGETPGAGPSYLPLAHVEYRGLSAACSTSASSPSGREERRSSNGGGSDSRATA